MDTQVRLRDGVTVKLVPDGRRGIPDRLVILPGGAVLFIELKRPKGGVTAKLQHHWRSWLTKRDHRAHIARTKGEIDDILGTL